MSTTLSTLLSTGHSLSTALICLGVCAALLALQWVLSGVKSRWPGLLLPALALVRAVDAAVEALAPALLLSSGGIMAVSPAPPSLPQALAGALAVLLMQTIPVAVGLAVCFLRRARRAKRQRELDRMEVQDL